MACLYFPDVWGLSQKLCLGQCEGLSSPKGCWNSGWDKLKTQLLVGPSASTYTSLLQMACASSQHGDWILRCGFQMEAFKEWAPKWWGKLHGLNGLVSELTQHHFYLVVRAVTRPPKIKTSVDLDLISAWRIINIAPIWKKKKKTKLHRHSWILEKFCFPGVACKISKCL